MVDSRIKKKTFEEKQFEEARRQIMELCTNAFEEGKRQQIGIDKKGLGYGRVGFVYTPTYKIIMSLKTVNEQITELLLKGKGL
jgi:hypothetical protein